MTGLPPVSVGGEKNTAAVRSPAVRCSFVGAPGTAIVAAAGLTAGDGNDADPVPVALVAVTVNVYEVPLVSPATFTYPSRRKSEAEIVVRCPPEDSTVYRVTGEPPSAIGWVQTTYANPSPAFADTRSGAAGAARVVKLPSSRPRYAGSSPALSTTDAGAPPGPVMSW